MKQGVLLGVSVAAALAGGCASYDGRGLVPGKSTAAEVEALMGKPAEKQERGGDTIAFYPRGPMGFHTYAVRIGPDGVMREIDQRLTIENVQKLAPESWTRKEVRDLLGPPFVVESLPRLKREVWEYQFIEVSMKWKLWVQFSEDGVLREVVKRQHPDQDPLTAGRGG